ncbi:MAG: GIY-YIG nuclease family protein [Actinomycetota bacterium]|nr:GIY-YIG nuclease family protein [Actinomycetota bacterium]
MLGTVILDAYSADRAQEMAAAIDCLCPPDASGPFAASGLYAFWDVASRDLLYIGRSNDLGIRFRQHNGLMPCPPAACKVEQIRFFVFGVPICARRCSGGSSIFCS